MCLHFQMQETGGQSKIKEPPPQCTGPVRTTAVATRQRRDDRERERESARACERIWEERKARGFSTTPKIWKNVLQQEKVARRIF